MTSRGAARRGIVVAVVAAGLAVAPTAAWADHSLVERVSTGPSGGNDLASADLVGITPDGAHAYFITSESLVAGDTDGGGRDLYDRSGGQTVLVTVGIPDGASPFMELEFGASSADGSIVLFDTDEPIVPEDTDLATDVYARTSGQTRLISTGPGDTDTEPSLFSAASADGTRVAFRTREALSDQDTDAQRDVYLRVGDETTPLTLGPSDGQGLGDAFLESLSDDGTVATFESPRAAGRRRRRRLLRRLHARRRCHHPADRGRRRFQRQLGSLVT